MILQAVLEKYEGDEFREELNNLFASIILYHIYWQMRK
jgi:hypothetical protein